MTPAIHVALVLALGVFAQWLAWRLRLPAIVLLLGSGVALGYFMPHEATGDQEYFFAFISLAVGVILFEGGLSLDFREIRETRGVVFRLVTVGLLVTWLATAALAHWVANFSIPTALLLGALLTVSGPTVVLPLLRHVQPVRRIGSLAKWEGIVNDPIGAVLAALVFEVVIHLAEVGELAAGQLVTGVGLTLFWGVLLGALGAMFLLQVLRRHLIPDYLQNPLVLAFVMLVFALANHLQHEAGLITVTLMGVFLANQHKVDVHHVIEFKENLRVLLISTLFVVLASRLDVSRDALTELGWGSVGLVLLMILVVRPVAVLISTIGSPLSWPERAFLAWIHPRGIVAAAVSSLLALEITRRLGGEHEQAAVFLEARRFELVVFLVIISTVTIYGLSLAPLARRLGLSGENPQGLLFAGANRPARELAAAIQDEGFTVLLVDTNPRNNSTARMAGLPVLHASVGSEFVQEEIDLGGIGRLLAMTPNDEVNTLACMGFSDRFGRSEVYQTAAPEQSSERTERVAAYRRGRTLFNRAITIHELEQRFEAGAKIKTTQISDDFSYADFLDRYGDTALVLLTIEGSEIAIATDDAEAAPRAGQKIMALVDAEPQDARPSPTTLSTSKESANL